MFASVNKAILVASLTLVTGSFYLKPLSGWGALPGYSDPGCMCGREESVLVVAEDRKEREREEKDKKTLAHGAQSEAV